jgi:hypothetical protein
MQGIAFSPAGTAGCSRIGGVFAIEIGLHY